MELVSPLANDFVLCCFVIYLVLVDIIAPRSIPILIELHRISSYA